MKLRKVLGIGCVGLLASAVVFWLAMLGVLRYRATNPFEKDDLCFREDTPGATSRFTVYIPVRCSDPTQHLGEAFGADYAELAFDDVDGDGTPELIVASSPFRCRFASGPCYDAWRITVKVCPTCPNPFTVLESRYLPELTPEGGGW
jgi:hypothetical protein